MKYQTWISAGRSGFIERYCYEKLRCAGLKPLKPSESRKVRIIVEDV
jgi:hypothetical protein